MLRHMPAYSMGLVMPGRFALSSWRMVSCKATKTAVLSFCFLVRRRHQVEERRKHQPSLDPFGHETSGTKTWPPPLNGTPVAHTAREATPIMGEKRLLMYGRPSLRDLPSIF